MRKREGIPPSCEMITLTQNKIKHVLYDRLSGRWRLLYASQKYPCPKIFVFMFITMKNDDKYPYAPL